MIFTKYYPQTLISQHSLEKHRIDGFKVLYFLFFLHNYPIGNIFTWLTKSLPIKLLIKCNCKFFFNSEYFFDHIPISDFINVGMKVNKKKNLEAIPLKIGDGYNIFQVHIISISPSQASKINLADWLTRLNELSG